MQYNIGDIVFALEALKEQKNESVKSHLFVIIDDDGNAVPADYFGFVISSNLDKSKENSPFKYNERINKNSSNNLVVDSIVKCDQPMSIPANNIYKKIGVVEQEDLVRFLNAFNNFLQEN